MTRLLTAGLVKRQDGRYFLGAYGNVIHDAQPNALENYWKPKAIDSLVTNDDDNNLSKKEGCDYQIKEVPFSTRL
jgi:hypothetical protein